MKNFLTIFIFFFSINQVIADSQSTSEDFGDWQFFCSEENSCEIRQIIIDEETKDLVSFISLTLNPENNIQLLLGLPHLINLKIESKVTIDNNPSIDVPYTYCNLNGCFIAEVISKEYINLMKQGAKMTFESFFINNDPYKIVYSLKGFTSSYDRLVN